MQCNGFQIYPGFLGKNAQIEAVSALRKIVKKAPFFRPVMPRTGKPFSVITTSAGCCGWVSDKHGGYRYQDTHPATDLPWPKIPDIFLDVWDELTGYDKPPECCLINLYQGESAKMGLHRDDDERDFAAPVLSISLGDTAVFRMGGLKRSDPTRSLKLSSGDVVTFGGEARLAYHGIDRVLAGSSTLLKQGGRINITLRRVSL